MNPIKEAKEAKQLTYSKIEAWNVDRRIGFIWHENRKVLVLKGKMIAPGTRGADLTGQWISFDPAAIVEGKPGASGKPGFVLSETPSKAQIVTNPTMLASLELSYVKPKIKLRPPMSGA